jgi:hypothetical protein
MIGNGRDSGPPQGQPQSVPIAEVQALVAELAAQRNMMADRCAQLAIRLKTTEDALAEARGAAAAPMAGEAVSARGPARAPQP